MRLITLALALAKIEVTHGTATRTDSGVTVTNPSGEVLCLPIQTVKAVIDDAMSFDAVTKMAIGANVPMSVFHLACKRIVDEYYTPGKKQRVMDTRLVVHDKDPNPIKSVKGLKLPATGRICVNKKRKGYEALHSSDVDG